MICRKYLPEDYYSLVSWLQHRKVDIWKFESVPRIGFIISNVLDDVAIGFLRKVEGKSCMIDGICTNPDMSSFDRNVAIDLLVKKLLAKAKKLKMISVIGISTEENIIKRANGFGFVQKPEQTIMGLSLGE